MIEQNWKACLSPEQFTILREEGTEPRYSSPLNHEQREGVFVCAGCGLALFTSAMKYDSHSGWPSFFDALPGRLQTKEDNKLPYPRLEYHCAGCQGHQGHLFEDGPLPTGKRYCNNGLALQFIPRALKGKVDF